MTAASSPGPDVAALNVEDHPLVEDVNAMHEQRLSGTERICRKIADACDLRPCIARLQT
jgi:hypothetical protein